MKPIEDLTNGERAKMLFQLFPEEVPALIAFVSGMCRTMKEEEEINRNEWKNGFVSYDYWLRLVDNVEAVIHKYGDRLCKSQLLFGDQLFDGLMAMVTIHCICTYTKIKQHANRKFVLLVDILFNP